MWGIEKDLSSINSYLRKVKVAYQFAIDRGYLNGENPATQVARFRVDKPSQPYCFSTDGIQAILKAIPATYHPIIRFALVTGLRRGECVRLKWDDIQKGNMRIMGKGSGRSRESKPKIAWLPLSDQAMRILGEIPRTGEYIEGPFPFMPMAITRAFSRAKITAKVKGGSFHALRDTFATWAWEDGADLLEVSQALRHSRVTVTQEHYIQMKAERLRPVMDRARVVNVPGDQPELKVHKST